VGLKNIYIWRQTADETLGNPPQGNQEPLVVNTRMKDPCELGVSKSVDYATFSL